MLEELHQEVLPEHRGTVEEEINRLSETVSRAFANSVDLDRAGVADPQGIGDGGAEPHQVAAGVHARSMNQDRREDRSNRYVRPTAG